MTVSALPFGAAAQRAPRPAATAPRSLDGVRGLRPVTLLRGALVLMMAGQLGRIPVLTSQGKDAPVLLNEVVLAAVLAATVIVCARARSLRLDGVAFAALAFAAVGGASVLVNAPEFRLSGYETFYSLAYLARWLAYFGVYVSIINTATPGDAGRLWRTLERALLGFTIFGIVQAIALPGFAQLVYPENDDAMGWDVQGHRLVSTLLDPNFAGALILLALLVLLARMAFGVRVPRWKPLTLITGLVLTFSRSSFLGLFVGGLVLISVRGLRRQYARIAAAVVAIALPFTPLIIRYGMEYQKFTLSDGSAIQRTIMWLRGLTVLADHPLLGIGFNTYGFVQRAYGWDIVGRDGFGLDGGLLFIGVMTGFVGLAVYVGMYALMWRRCQRVWRDAAATPEARGTALGVAAASLAIVVHSCFVNSLLLPFVMEPLWVLWGLVFLYRHESRPVVEPRRSFIPAPV
ncbi:MAG TPA: O-antigen ligase family protein [Gemmatirosa sp.]